MVAPFRRLAKVVPIAPTHSLERLHVTSTKPASTSAATRSCKS
jgi:hypothetical protein